MKLWSDCAWIHGGYDMMLGTSWGFAGRDLQRTWKTMGCDAVMKAKAPPPWTDPFWQKRMSYHTLYYALSIYHIIIYLQT